jgi:hypothetical protein
MILYRIINVSFIILICQGCINCWRNLLLYEDRLCLVTSKTRGRRGSDRYPLSWWFPKYLKLRKLHTLHNVKCDATGDKHGSQQQGTKQKCPVWRQYYGIRLEKTWLVLSHPAWRLYHDANSTFWVEGQSKSTKKNTQTESGPLPETWTHYLPTYLPTKYERNTVITRCSTAQMMTTDCHQHLEERNIPCRKACLGPSQSHHGIRKKKIYICK